MKAALLQITSSDAPEDNLALVQGLVREAAAVGADIAFTPPGRRGSGYWPARSR